MEATSAAELEIGTSRGSAKRSAELVISFVAGLIFAAGLVLSGMTQPEKIIGFLDIKEMFVGAFPGQWNYTLGIVMAGAVAISLLAFSLTPYASIRPWFAANFVWPRRAGVDATWLWGRSCLASAGA